MSKNKGIVLKHVIVINIIAIIASLIQYVNMIEVDPEIDIYHTAAPKYEEYIGYSDVSYAAGAILFGMGLIVVIGHLIYKRKEVAANAKSGTLSVFWALIGSAVVMVVLLQMDPLVSDYYKKTIDASEMQNITLFVWPLVTLFLFALTLGIIRSVVETDADAEKLYYLDPGKGNYNMMMDEENEHKEFHYKEIYK